MSPKKQLENFAQSVHRTVKNRFFDDISGEDGQVYVSQIIEELNDLLDELEYTVTPEGRLVDWWFLRSNEYVLGTAVQNEASIVLSKDVGRVITDEYRYVQVKQDGIVISNWAVVNPKDITNASNRIIEDTCAVVGGNLIFSRPFKDTENNGDITGDILLAVPKVSETNIKALSMIKPKRLLTLGVAKNIILPDIVNGGLTPSFSRKYDQLLNAAVRRSTVSSIPSQVYTQDFSGVGGLY